MTAADYVGVVLAIVGGVLLVIHRKRAAQIAIRQHETLYGRKWDQRSFEYPAVVVGLLWIAWALFMLVGSWFFAR